MFLLQKKATPADRARRRVQTHAESLVQTFVDGFVRVEAMKPATMHYLRRRGWSLVEGEVAPLEVSADREKELFSMTVRELRSLARDYKVPGRTLMKEAELVAAILEHESAQ